MNKLFKHGSLEWDSQLVRALLIPGFQSKSCQFTLVLVNLQISLAGSA